MEFALIQSLHRMVVKLKLPIFQYSHADAGEFDFDSLWSTDGDGAQPEAYWDTVGCCSLNYSKSCCSTVLLRSNCWGSTYCCRDSGDYCTSWCPTLIWMSCWTWVWEMWGMNWCILVGVQVTLKKKQIWLHWLSTPKVTYLSKRSKPQLELIRNALLLVCKLKRFTLRLPFVKLNYCHRRILVQQCGVFITDSPVGKWCKEVLPSCRDS